jgi:hypothetical protein
MRINNGLAESVIAETEIPRPPTLNNQADIVCVLFWLLVSECVCVDKEGNLCSMQYVIKHVFVYLFLHSDDVSGSVCSINVSCRFLRHTRLASHTITARPLNYISLPPPPPPSFHSLPCAWLQFLRALTSVRLHYKNSKKQALLCTLGVAKPVHSELASPFYNKDKAIPLQALRVPGG